MKSAGMTIKKTVSGDVGNLLDLLDEAFDRKAWHGPNLWGAVRRLSEKEAAARPGPGRPSIHELVLHCAYWKYAVRRRLTGEKRGSFALEGRSGTSRITARRLIAGVAAHDVYHAGQVRLILKLGSG